MFDDFLSSIVAADVRKFTSKLESQKSKAGGQRPEVGAQDAT
jgi:hypothetical protein